MEKNDSEEIILKTGNGLKVVNQIHQKNSNDESKITILKVKEDIKDITKVKIDKNVKNNEKSESVVDKYLFFLYALIFIILVNSDVNVFINYNCYASLSALFNMTGIDTSIQVSSFKMIPTITNNIHTISINNYLLQVTIFIYLLGKI